MWGRDRVQSESLAPGGRVCVQNTPEGPGPRRGTCSIGFSGLPAPTLTLKYIFKYLPCFKNFTFMGVLAATSEVKSVVPFCC